MFELETALLAVLFFFLWAFSQVDQFREKFFYGLFLKVFVMLLINIGMICQWQSSVAGNFFIGWREFCWMICSMLSNFFMFFYVVSTYLHVYIHKL